MKPALSPISVATAETPKFSVAPPPVAKQTSFQQEPPEPANKPKPSAESLGVKQGQIWVAADGGHYGVIVHDTERYKELGDVILHPFVGRTTNMTKEVRMDASKVKIRYRLAKTLPQWLL